MPSSTSTTNLLLIEHRAMYRTAALRANRAWDWVIRLRNANLWLARESTLTAIAHSLYYSARYSAGQDYETCEDFREELIPDVDAKWPERATLGGVEHYVLRPTFNSGTPYLSELSLGYLHGCNPEPLKVLAEAAPVFPEISEVSGLYEDELRALCERYVSKTLNIINALRHLATALHYLKIAAEQDSESVRRMGRIVFAPEFKEGVYALEKLSTLPFLPAPAPHYGTIADQINPLKRLPGTPGEVIAALA